MSWGSAFKRAKPMPDTISDTFMQPAIEQHVVDWNKLVVLDFESYYDVDYTLRKMSTSEYIRDDRFHAQMVGIKVGKKPVKVYHAPKVHAALTAIDWSTHTLLCHNTPFDGFILSHHYDIKPRFYYDTLSMARALHKNDISAKLGDVAMYYGKGNKIEGVLDEAKGVRVLPKDLAKRMADYCGRDVELCLEIFKEMLPKMPHNEMRLIDHVIRMFTDPVLKVDLPRVQAELEREIKEKEDLLISTLGTPAKIAKLLLTQGKEKVIEDARKVIGSSEKFAALLTAEGVIPPVKVSPAWIKKPKEERDDNDPKKYTFAFAKTDQEFVALKEHPKKRVRDLVEARLTVKSTINETRAERFLKAGANGWSLPVLLVYAAAHTLRLGGGNKMNMQNLPRGGELRKSILAPKGHRIVVADSGQIEARVNGWLWGQEDLIDAFRKQDSGVDKDHDAYTAFAELIYGREITKADKNERFVGKVGILGLGYQMGTERLQTTLALGIMGPPVFLDLPTCQRIVQTYRRKNYRIKMGWDKCTTIIEDMAAGRTGSWKCISWEKERLWLPNGQCLKYPNLRRKDHANRTKAKLLGENYVPDSPFVEWVYDRKDEEAKIYGGLLCENIVQALSRIIVSEQLLVIAEKYRVVMFTHDEVVTCVPTKQADKAFAFMVKTMRTPLRWCADLPLFAEGGHAENYSK